MSDKRELGGGERIFFGIYGGLLHVAGAVISGGGIAQHGFSIGLHKLGNDLIKAAATGESNSTTESPGEHNYFDPD